MRVLKISETYTHLPGVHSDQHEEFSSSYQADEDLRKRAPSHRVEAYVNVEHRGHGLTCRGRVRGTLRGREDLQESSDDEEEDAHAHARDEERQLAPERVDEEEHEDRRRDDLHDPVDARREQRVRGARVSDLTGAVTSERQNTNTCESWRERGDARM